MKTLVIDASTAVKWVIEGVGTPEEIALRQRTKLVAPDLLVAECANIFLEESAKEGAPQGGGTACCSSSLGRQSRNCFPCAHLFEGATRLSIEIDHPAYECVYLALAAVSDCQFVTTDEHFLRKAHQKQRSLRGRIVSLNQAAML